MKIGCGTVCFREYSLEEALTRIRNAGYEYVEPQATAPFCPHIDVDKDNPETFKKTITDLGFKGATALWSTHGAIIPDPLSVEYGKKCVEWAAAADIPVVNIGDGFKEEGTSDEQALEILEQRLAQILETAEKCQVYLAIEPHGTFSLNSSGLKKIMSLSNSRWLGINYDTANIHRASYVETKDGVYTWKSADEKQNEVDVLKEIIGKVVHVHVKDVAGEECVALGKGEVDNKSCLKVLKENNYNGVLSLETEGDFNAQAGEVLIRESREYLLRILKEIYV